MFYVLEVLAPNWPLVMAGKRHRSSPTGRTPRQLSKRRPRVLTFNEENTPAHSDAPVTGTLRGTWSEEETKALLTFLLLNQPEDNWPVTKSQVFWFSASEFVQQVGKTSVRRSGKANQMLGLLQLGS